MEEDVPEGAEPVNPPQTPGEATAPPEAPTADESSGTASPPEAAGGSCSPPSSGSGIQDEKKDDEADPDKPIVACAFACAAGVGLAGLALLGLRAAALGMGSVIVVIDAALLTIRWWSLRGPRERNVARARASRYGVGVSVVAVLVLVLACVPFLVTDVFGPHLGFAGHRLWPIRGFAISVVCFATVIHISALIDWAHIRLRLLGVLGNAALPCQGGRDGVANWRSLTRIWLAHRLVAFVIGRLAVAAAIGFSVALVVINVGASPKPAQTLQAPAATTARASATTSASVQSASNSRTSSVPGGSQGKSATNEQTPSQPVLAALGTITAAVIVFFINRFLPVLSLVQNPRLSVGDRIVLAEEYGTGVTSQPSYYVVDVAMEGIKLLQLDKAGLPKGSAGRDPQREHDRSLPLVDVPRLLRVRGRFTACDQVCTKAFHDCPIGFGNPVDPDVFAADVDVDIDKGVSTQSPSQVEPQAGIPSSPGVTPTPASGADMTSAEPSSMPDEPVDE